MLKIRLQRIGRKHEPVFRLVLTDSKNSTKSGRFHETIGSYDSRRGEKALLNEERIKYWISKGAQLSGTVHNMLVDRKIINGKKINVLPQKKPIVKDAPQVEAKTSSENPVAEQKEEAGTLAEDTKTE